MYIVKSKPKTITDHLHKEINLPKKIAIDILGVLLILASGLVGWLPGPGGLPLFLGGLSLLAKNHHWAHNLLEQLKINGNKVIKLVFRDHPVLVIVYDILASILFIIVISYLVESETYRLIWLIAFLLGVSVALFLGNRGRYDKLEHKFKKALKSRIKKSKK